MARIDGLEIRATFLEAFREVALKFTQTGDAVRLERVWTEYEIKTTGVPYDPSLSKQENIPRMWVKTRTPISREEFAIPVRLANTVEGVVSTILAAPLPPDEPGILDGLDVDITWADRMIGFSNPSLNMPGIGRRFERLIGWMAQDSPFKLRWKSIFL